jgi:hypothetical protein
MIRPWILNLMISPVVVEVLNRTPMFATVKAQVCDWVGFQGHGSECTLKIALEQMQARFFVAGTCPASLPSTVGRPSDTLVDTVRIVDFTVHRLGAGDDSSGRDSAYPTSVPWTIPSFPQDKVKKFDQDGE